MVGVRLDYCFSLVLTSSLSLFSFDLSVVCLEDGSYLTTFELGFVERGNLLKRSPLRSTRLPKH